MEPVKEIQQTAKVYPQLESQLATRDLDSDQKKVVDDVLEGLKKGSVLWKVRSLNNWYRRFYLLDEKNYVLKYEPSHKPGCYRETKEIDIEDILDVRKGWKTDTFNKIGRKVEKKLNKSPQQAPIVREECCFSVIHGKSKQTLDLVAPDPSSADEWVRGLSTIVNTLKTANKRDIFERWLQEQFEEADSDKSGELNFEECCILLRQLNVQMTNEAAEKIFNEANINKTMKNGQQVLDFTEFTLFLNNLRARPEITEIYEKYSLPFNNEMDVGGLRKFFKDQNGLDLSVKECEQEIENHEPSELKYSSKLSPLGFANLLMAEKNEIFNFEHRFIYQDMTQPLAHYYMASSHNTYLTGGQLRGESSVEGYIDALVRGCRCVELDCWDGPDDEPIIYHGYTLTSKILFRDVLTDAIKPFAFKTSDYPVVLSLENHCTEKQQKIMAKHMRNILTNDDKTSMLYDEEVCDDLKNLPSPEDLKYKIIVKAKKCKPNADEGQKTSDCESSSEEEEKESTERDEKGVAEDLSNLVNICQAVHFHGFEHTKNKGKCFEMSSLSEAKAEKLILTNCQEFVDYNTRHLSRIYPSGTRTGSSNFKPTPFWNVGCQIVALNYQSSKKPIFINEAKFRQNGNCGYLLKPSYLRENQNYAGAPIDGGWKVLKLKIISGQFIPKSNPEDVDDVVDPFVKVKITGHAEDAQKTRTQFIKNNVVPSFGRDVKPVVSLVLFDRSRLRTGTGFALLPSTLGFNPMWNEEMEFVLKMPELAMVWMIVKDESKTGTSATLGLSAVPFSSLGLGYRHVFLMDYTRKLVSPASLFVHVSISDYVVPSQP